MKKIKGQSGNQLCTFIMKGSPLQIFQGLSWEFETVGDAGTGPFGISCRPRGLEWRRARITRTRAAADPF